MNDAGTIVPGRKGKEREGSQQQAAQSGARWTRPPARSTRHKHNSARRVQKQKARWGKWVAYTVSRAICGRFTGRRAISPWSSNGRQSAELIHHNTMVM